MYICIYIYERMRTAQLRRSRFAQGLSTEHTKEGGGGIVPKKIGSLDATSDVLAHAGAFGAGPILELCAQLVWCERCTIFRQSSEAVLGVWLPAPLPTPRALPDHGAIWPLAVGVEKDLGGIDV